MALADQKIAGLSHEVKKLKDEQLEYVKTNEFLKKQVNIVEKLLLVCIRILFI